MALLVLTASATGTLLTLPSNGEDVVAINPEKSSPKRSFSFWYWENGKQVSTNWTMVSKGIRMDSSSAEAREYIRIARAITTSNIAIPGDVVPNVDKHGEWAVVTFHLKEIKEGNSIHEGGYKKIWEDYYTEVIIEAKTKAVRVITLNENLENKKLRSAEDFTPLTAESKVAPTTYHIIKKMDKDDEGGVIIHSYVALKKLRLDLGDEKVAEYVRIARAAAKQDKDADRIEVVVHGETIVVTFLAPPGPRIGGHGVDVFMDIKTKAVLFVMAGV
jgi:hypothetical protein